MDDAGRGQVAASAADVYEEFFVPALFGQFAPVMVELSKVGRGDRLLDVATGTGVVARAAVETVGRSGGVVGIDINPGMLSVAGRQSSEVTWLEAAAEHIPMDDSSVDASTCQFALMFFDDPLVALSEMRRVVRPGGRIVVSTWADISQSPGYAAMSQLLDREIGKQATEAILAPFSIGTEQALANRFEGVLDVTEVRTQPGTARFESLDAWMYTDIRGWTLSEMIDEATFQRLLDAAHRELGEFVATDGRVRFDAPALIAIATVPG